MWVTHGGASNFKFCQRVRIRNVSVTTFITELTRSRYNLLIFLGIFKSKILAYIFAVFVFVLYKITRPRMSPPIYNTASCVTIETLEEKVDLWEQELAEARNPVLESSEFAYKVCARINDLLALCALFDHEILT